MQFIGINRNFLPFSTLGVCRIAANLPLDPCRVRSSVCWAFTECINAIHTNTKVTMCFFLSVFICRKLLFLVQK